MINYVHYDSLPELTLEIAKPNREIIGRITTAFGRKQSIKLGQINEINFTVPYIIHRDGELIRNPIIDKLRSQYHIRATFGSQIEWFVIANKQSTTSDDGKSFLHIQLKSLGYQLTSKKIRTWIGVFIDGEYRKESLNAQQVLENLLQNSAWSIDYIDSEFLTKYRTFDFSSTNVLEAIFRVAETFGAIIKWNTVNKSISLFKQENIGINKGGRISERKYLKSINKEEKSDEIVTVLHVYGKDGLSINRVNPTGQSYLMDLTYFLYPFQRDSNKNVISSSDYMSDSLCHALLDYQDVIENNRGQFNIYLENKTSLESQLSAKEVELTNLHAQLIIVQEAIDIKQTNNLDASVELAQQADLQNQISTKEIERQTIIDQMNIVSGQLISLKAMLSMESNFTPEQIIELDDYLHEETWEDQNYTDDEELFTDAQKVFDELKKPKEIITTDIVNIYKLLEGNKEWEKFEIGDKLFIDYERFQIDVETQLIEMEIDHDGTDIAVTFANTKDIERDEDKLSKLLYGSVSAASSYSMSKYKYDQINNIKNDVTELINSEWDSAKNAVVSGVNNSVEINHRGVTISSSDDPNKFIRMTNGVIGLTQDGGNTFKTAITPSHIVAERLMGKMTITEQMYVANVSGKYRIDQDGMVIDGGSLKITGGLPPSQLDLELGGRNYILNSKHRAKPNDFIMIQEFSSEINELDGEEVTFSFEVRTTDSTHLDVYLDSSVLINMPQILSASPQFKKFTFTSVFSDNPEYRWIEFTNQPLEVRNLKLEKGNKATDWTIAPEENIVKGEVLNGVRLDAENGLTVTRTDDKVKAVFNATEGIKFQVKEGASWKDSLFYDVNNARLTFDGEINAKELKVNGQSVLTADKFKINGGFIDRITTDQLVAGNAKIGTAMIENLVVGTNVTMGANASINWNTQVANKPFIPQSASDIGAMATSTYIDAGGVYTGQVYADRLYGRVANVSEKVYIGSNFKDNTQKGIYFRGDLGGVSITSDNADWLNLKATNSLVLYTSGYLDLDGRYTRMLGGVDFAGATSVNWGNYAPVAKFG